MSLFMGISWISIVMALVITALLLTAVLTISLQYLKGHRRRSAGKQKELQRPFNKRKGKQLSPQGKKQSFQRAGTHLLQPTSYDNSKEQTPGSFSKKAELSIQEQDNAHPKILSTVMATIRGKEEKDPAANNNRQMLSPEETVLTNSLHDNHNVTSPSNATSTDNNYLDSHKATYEGVIQNPFVLRKCRSSSVSPPESRIGNLSNQSTGYLLGNSGSSSEHDHSYCQLKLFSSLFDTPVTTSSVEEFDDNLSILDMSLSLAWEEPLSDEITESSHSMKNSVSSYTDLSQTSRTSAGDELEKRYTGRYPEPQLCHCSEMMTFAMTDLWAHKCNSALGYHVNNGSVSSQDENNQSKYLDPANEYGDDHIKHKCHDSEDYEASSSDSLVYYDGCTAPSEKEILPLLTCTEAPCSYKTSDSNTPTANLPVNRNHPPVLYCKHMLQKKLGDELIKNRARGNSTSEGLVSLQPNHSQFDSRRWYSLGSLCDDNHSSPNDVIKHDYAHTHGHERVRVDLDLSPEPYNDTGYTSTADTDSPVKEDNEAENESYDADCESDDAVENSESVLVSGEMGEINDAGDVQRSSVSIGEAVLIEKYAMQEWKGETSVAETMRKGYVAIPSHVNCHHLHQVRGDNYCAIRATLFQALLNDVPVLARYPAIDALAEMPGKMYAEGFTWIKEWSFANRIQLQMNDIIKTLEDYLLSFIKEVNEVNALKSKKEKMTHLLALFDKDFINVELKLLEAVKFLMMVTAVELYKKLNRQEKVPDFAMLIFARDTSPNLQGLLQRHLNHVGDSGGLEQVEMHLLGYALNVVIEVIRPSQVDKEDFIARYPSKEDAPSLAHSVTLVAEDDRHYNLIM